MADGILYLDIDDEITSAAARVRDVSSGRVAVVLPYGSRVATSRINFRLLARDAQTHEKRLSVISSDSATRALAASAGLPVFASVQEYEASLPPTRDAEGDAAPVVAASAAAVREAKRAAAAAGGPDAGAAPAFETGVSPSGHGTATETARVDAPAAPPVIVPVDPPPTDKARRSDVPATASRAGSRRAAIVVGLAVLALAVLVGGVGAYLFLPSATIVVTPKTKAVGPIELVVVADPATTQPDASARTVPAESLSVDVAVSDTFPATGKRVTETAATGTVQFQNLDFTSSNTIPAGSIVSASGGIRFRTNKSITVRAARLVGLSIVPTTASVGVTAVKPGPEGNLEPNTILTIPRGESPLTLKVTNPDATTGGTREEFPRVTQKDVDAALAALDVALKAGFEAKVADPALAPAGATVFPETAHLGEATPSVDPATLVGTEAATFDLDLSATGTVIAVDDAPVASIAESGLAANVVSGYQLVEDSVDVQVGAAIVEGDQVSFPVTVSATQVAVLDPTELEALVLGKTPQQAQVALSPYGTAVISLSPDWATTIPTFENRVDLSVADTGPSAAPGASASP
jgi:predicted secreted protein